MTKSLEEKNLVWKKRRKKPFQGRNNSAGKNFRFSEKKLSGQIFGKENIVEETICREKAAEKVLQWKNFGGEKLARKEARKKIWRENSCRKEI